MDFFLGKGAKVRRRKRRQGVNSDEREDGLSILDTAETSEETCDNFGVDANKLTAEQSLSQDDLTKRIKFEDVMLFVDDQIKKMADERKMAFDVMMGPEITKETRKRLEANLVNRGFGVFARPSSQFPPLSIWHIRRAAIYTTDEYK